MVVDVNDGLWQKEISRLKSYIKQLGFTFSENKKHWRFCMFYCINTLRCSGQIKLKLNSL